MNLTEEPIQQFMSLDDAAQRLKISKRTLSKYIVRKENPLPAVYLSDRTIRIPYEQFDLWIESMKERG